MWYHVKLPGIFAVTMISRITAGKLRKVILVIIYSPQIGRNRATHVKQVE